MQGPESGEYPMASKDPLIRFQQYGEVRLQTASEGHPQKPSLRTMGARYSTTYVRPFPTEWSTEDLSWHAKSSMIPTIRLYH